MAVKRLKKCHTYVIRASMAKVYVYNFSTIYCCFVEIIFSFFIIFYGKSKYVVLLVAHYFFIVIKRLWSLEKNNQCSISNRNTCFHISWCGLLQLHYTNVKCLQNCLFKKIESVLARTPCQATKIAVPVATANIMAPLAVSKADKKFPWHRNLHRMNIETPIGQIYYGISLKISS